MVDIVDIVQFNPFTLYCLLDTNDMSRVRIIIIIVIVLLLSFASKMLKCLPTPATQHRLQYIFISFAAYSPSGHGTWIFQTLYLLLSQPVHFHFIVFMAVYLCLCVDRQ